MRILSTEPIKIIDPSELLRPEIEFMDKPIEKFRDYSIDENDKIKERVRKTYHEMHTYQTMDFVKDQRKKWLNFSHFEATIREALEKLNELVDESDPDVDIPNIIHAFQTAEKIREEHPNLDWFHLTGLIHDLGKVMVFYNEPQWAVVGDTFVVGCAWSDNIVYRDTSFVDNVDRKNPAYTTKLGIYTPNCGLDQVNMSWGHDEYLYCMLKHNNTTLPDEALYMIRYHSFYPWHASDDYNHLQNEKDTEMKKWVKLFNKYDLYTKSPKVPDIEQLWPYYQSLIDKYIPGVLKW